VLKDVEPDELKQAIRAVARGEAYLHPALTRQVLDRLARNTPLPSRSTALFTPRELEILQFMATPFTYREIAEQLSISEETVRSHAKHILNKLGQPNRVQAVLAAVRSGLIQIPEVEEE
jgi:DNA-binding NarL/FixJ family response regulator